MVYIFSIDILKLTSKTHFLNRFYKKYLCLTKKQKRTNSWNLQLGRNQPMKLFHISFTCRWHWFKFPPLQPLSSPSSSCQLCPLPSPPWGPSNSLSCCAPTASSPWKQEAVEHPEHPDERRPEWPAGCNPPRWSLAANLSVFPGNFRNTTGGLSGIFLFHCPMSGTRIESDWKRYKWQRGRTFWTKL